MKSAEIRTAFLKFFESKGHTIVPSSSLVPGNDPTLLFTNSGMVQFKDVFLGREQRSYRRATSAQRSVRAGGKHNDLENVGYTARHHTFFEMLGNFSFGDYFKRDAIQYAWELLTQVYRLPVDKLWVTVYAEDDEAYALWADLIGVPPERIVRIGDNKGARYASDNFWQMAETGPCGPCTEIFFDHGPTVAGGPPGSPEEDGDRYIEIWNLVFMQYERDAAGVLTPLPRPCVDTGMGLERLAAVLQHVHSNYEIDLFQNLIAAASRVTGANDLASPSLRVIADHIRACAFLVVDGVIPGNEGRGYVLRRIARRAMRHGHKLGCTGLFFHHLVADLDAAMGDAYPELRAARLQVEAVLKQEEERFAETLAHGLSILASALQGGSRVLDGETAFKLYDTYGFPLDLTADVCREREVAVDEAGFERAMARQREQARAAGKFRAESALAFEGTATTFVGYDALEQTATVKAIFVGGTAVPAIEAQPEGSASEAASMEAGARSAVIVLDATPFYAESGGQVGDSGALVAAAANFVVDDTQKVRTDVAGHHGRLLHGRLAVGDQVLARVDLERRETIRNNHSATHLLHAALRDVLGVHVAQKGSLVDEQRTRFDFSHHSPVSPDEIRRIEVWVNTAIRANVPVSATLMAFDDAVAAGAMALFGEKYGAEVRVLGMGSFSTELCGGTHVSRTGDIGLFKVLAEAGVAAGVRRIEATTGAAALAQVQSVAGQLSELAGLLKAPVDELPVKLAHVLAEVRTLEKEVARYKAKAAASAGSDLASLAVSVSGTGGALNVLAVRLEGADAGQLRQTLDALKTRLGSAAIVLATVADGKVQLAAGVTPDATARVKAGELVNFVAQQVGGKGGGRADLAMAGGTDPLALDGALRSVADWVAQRA
jgi:alanyl-tRNA synthetase